MMKHEISTLNTKTALAASLKKLMEEKQMSKITVSDIIRDCGVNRKTFYYHFTDINDLVKWMFDQEAINVVRNFDLLSDYEKAILFVIDYVDKNKHIINCTYDALGRGHLKQFFYDDFYAQVSDLIEDIRSAVGCDISDEYKDFVAVFYTGAIAGALLNYVNGELDMDRQKLTAYLCTVFREAIPAIITAEPK